MGIFSFFRKKKEPLPIDMAKLEPTKLETFKPTGLEGSSIENVRAKMDLLLTQLDSLRTQYEILNERTKNIEVMVQEIRSYYYRK